MNGKPKDSLGISIEDAGIKSSLEKLVEQHYSLVPAEQLDSKRFVSVIVDKQGLSKFSPEELAENLSLPVIYLMGPDEQTAPSDIIRHNIFRTISAKGGSLEQIIEFPPKDNPVKQLIEVVNFAKEVRNYIKNSSIMENTKREDVEKWMRDESYYTTNGNYGANRELKPIRGNPRQLSRIEELYQALNVQEFEAQQKRSAYNILLRLNDSELLKAIKQKLEDGKYRFAATEDSIDTLKKLSTKKYNMLIADYSKDMFDYITFEKIRKAFSCDALEIVLLADYADIPGLMKMGCLQPEFSIHPKKPANSDYSMLAQLIERSIKERHKEIVMQHSESIQGLIDVCTKYKLKFDDAIASEAIRQLFKEGAEENAISAMLRLINKRTWAGTRKDRLIIYCYNVAQGIKTGVENIEAQATDIHYRFKPDLPENMSVGKIWFRKTRDYRRALCEAEALKEIARRNKELPSADLELPRINTKRLKKEIIRNRADNIYLLLTNYIEGPTFEEITPQLGKEIAQGNKKAIEFRRQALFETNRYLAYLQTNPIKLPEGVKEEITDFGGIAKKSLLDNLKFFKKTFSPETLSVLCGHIDALESQLNTENLVQYFDFNRTNFIFATRSKSLADMLDSAEKEGMRQFVRKTLHKIDYNKIFRLTSQVEDRRLGSPLVDQSEDEQHFYDRHFLLYKKKFQLLSQQIEDSKKQGLFDQVKQLFTTPPSGIKEINGLIDKMESKSTNQEDEQKISYFIMNDINNFYEQAPYVELYRYLRAFDSYLRRDLIIACKKRKQEQIESVQKFTLNYLKKASDSLDMILHINEEAVKNSSAVHEDKITENAKHGIAAATYVKQFLSELKETPINYAMLAKCHNLQADEGR